MKKIILLLLIIIPSIGYSQSESEIYQEYRDSFYARIPEGIGKPILMPDPGYGGDFNIERIAPYEAKLRILVIVSDSLYRKIFSRYNLTNDSLKAFKGDKNDWYYQWMVKHHVDSIPAIDFKKYEIALFSACAQCLTHCDHDTGNQSCHRNACNFSNRWFIREKITGN